MSLSRPLSRSLSRGLSRPLSGIAASPLYLEWDWSKGRQILRKGAPEPTFSRASSGTRRRHNGLVELLGNDILRHDYEPTLDRWGALLEAQKANLFLNSATPANQGIAVTAQQYTLSFYGTGSIALTGSHTATLVGTGAENRVSLTFTATAGTLTLTVSGSTTKAQVETGGLSSYIPTAAAAATRQADTMAVSNMSWFNPSEGTFIAEVGAYPGSVTTGVREIVGMGSGNDRILLRVSVLNQLVAYVGNGTTLNGPIDAGTTAPTSREYLALSYSTVGGSYLSRRIGAGVAASSANIGNFSGAAPASMTIGANLDGHLRRLLYSPTAMTPAEARAYLDAMP